MSKTVTGQVTGFWQEEKADQLCHCMFACWWLIVLMSADRQTDKKTYRLTERQTGRETYRQTY